MHIFTRHQTMRPGRVTDAIAWVTQVGKATHERTGVAMIVSESMLGFAVNTLVLSARVDSIAHFEQYSTALADAARQSNEALDELFATPATDSVADVLAATNVGEPRPYNAVVSATINVSAAEEAVAWGIELSQYFGELTQFPTIFARVPFGRVGQVQWNVGLDRADDIDRLNDLIERDSGCTERLTRGAVLLDQPATVCRLTRRLDPVEDRS